MFINYTLSTFLDLQWAETKELEYILLVYPAFFYSTITHIYHGAYYKKHQMSTLNTFFLALSGLFITLISLSETEPLILDGQVTSDIIFPLLGLLWLTSSVTYLVKRILDKRRAAEESDDEI